MNLEPSGCNPDCPACPHRSWTEEASLARKQSFLEKTLQEWKDKLKPIRSLHGNARWGYRRQAVLHTYWDDGWKYGLRKKDDIIPIPDCPVHHQSTNMAFRVLTGILPDFPHIPLVFLVLSGAQLVMVVKSRILPDIEQFTTDDFSVLKESRIEGLWLHLHPSAGKKVFGKGGWQLLWGEPRSRDENGMLYGPASFQQLIPELYKESLMLAADFLQPGPGSAMIDLYCGTGNSIRKWKESGAEVAGVEWSGEAVECAKLNVPGVEIYRGLCHERIPQLRDWSGWMKQEGRRPLLYANPPRTGLEPEVTDWIRKEYRPECIAYLSCSTGTLRRDLEILENSGYKVAALQPYDFFPQTRHIECLALLSLATSIDPSLRLLDSGKH